MEEPQPETQGLPFETTRMAPEAPEPDAGPGAGTAGPDAGAGAGAAGPSSATDRTPSERLLPDRRLVQRDYLLRISRAISARLDLREVLSLVIRYAVDITGGRAGAIALRDDDGALSVAASFHARAEYRDSLDALVSSGVGRSSPDAGAGAELAPAGARRLDDQVVALPLVVSEEEIGRLFIIRSEGAAVFTPLDSQLLSAFADQAAVAIQNARGYADLSARAAELEALSGLSLALLKAAGRSAAMDVAARQVVAAGPSDLAVILHFRRDATRPTAAVAAVDGAGPAVTQAPGDLVGGLDEVTSEIMIAGRPRRWGSDEPLPGVLASRGMTGALAVPIDGASGPRGVLWAARRQGDYGDSNVQFLTTLAHTVGIALDRIRVLEELAARRRELVEVIDRHPSGMIVLDRTGRVRAMNPAAKRILRVPGAQAGDQPLQDIIQLETEAGVPVPLPDRLPGEATTARGLVSGAGDHRPFVQIRVSPLGARRASADAEGPPNILTPGHQVADAKMGAADVDVAGGPRAAEGLDGYLAEIVDLTAYKESEDAKGAFLAGLSHELKTPLSLIRGYAETLTQASLRDDPALTATALDVILTETQRLTEMVDRLLYAARVQAGELRLEVDEVDLQRLLGRLVDEFRDLHGDYLWVLTPAQVDTVIGDAARLREVFANLLSNAVKFSPQGSLIRIEPTQDGPDVAVSVTDEGIGIDVADQDRVFDRFFRATDKVEGTGLGLFMSRAIVEAHGGSIALRSRLGHGSTFTVRLPRSRGEGAPRGVPAGAPREAPR